MEFCKRHKDCSNDAWKRVIWLDETKVNRFQFDCQEYFWKLPHERIHMNHVNQTIKHGGGMGLFYMVTCGYTGKN